MKQLNIKMPMSIFTAGVVFFLSANLGVFSPSTTYFMYMMGLLIEMVGIVAAMVVFYRYRLTEMYIKGI